MKPRRALCLSLLCLLTAFALPAAEKPNILLILADDLGRNDLGAYGSRFYRTPNLDRLAQEGMLFTDAYAASPVCSPTRAAILTGKHPARLHLTDWLPGRADRPDQRLLRPPLRQQLPLEEETLAEALRRAGYTTGHIGKWHLGGEGFGPREQGFEVNIAGDHTGTPLSYFAPFRGRGHDGRQRHMPGLEDAAPGEYLTDRLTAEAEKFIETNRDRPFFLHLAHYDVHTPIIAKKEHVERYPILGDQPGRQTNRVYAAKVQSLDESVGRVLQKLADLQLDRKTLVIFTSDNGGLCVIEGPNTPATINAPLREGKGYLYEGGTRVPLLIRWPGVTRPGSTSATPVISHDLFPTLLDACGAPAGAAPDGLSLLPVLRGGALRPRALFWHYPHYSNQGGMPGAAIREGDWKLIEFYEHGRWELFNLANDPRESRNLVEDEPEVARRLGKKLDDWRIAVAAQMMLPNPDFTPNPQAADGTITLPARWARVHGTQLRYEPLPHKNTLGFWTQPADRAEFEFTVTQPGTFVVEAHQGCGAGQGGSVVEFTVARQTLTMTVEDTGHFQNFKPRNLGTVNLAQPGRYTLRVEPKSRAKAAVMDLRQVILRPAR